MNVKRKELKYISVTQNINNKYVLEYCSSVWDEVILVLDHRDMIWYLGSLLSL